jgi:hypothetical protein
MEKTSAHLDEYSTKINDNPNYIAYDMVDTAAGSNNCGDDLLSIGERIIEKSEKQKEMP